MKKWFAKVTTRLIILIIFIIMTKVIIIIIIIINVRDIFLPEIVEIYLRNDMKWKYEYKIKLTIIQIDLF